MAADGGQISDFLLLEKKYSHGGDRMLLATTAEARRLDQVAMEDFGLPEAVLMENAGASVVRLMKDHVSWKEQHVTVICGTGNNGGDGFVIARYAQEAGAWVTVLLMGNEAHMSEASRRYRQVAEKMHIPVIPISNAQEGAAYIEKADILVNALIGTGLTKGVTGEKGKLISLINEARGGIISVDVPSGLLCDTGEAPGAVVEADYTVALGSRKRGHVLYPGSLYTGHLLYDPIGIPDLARISFPVELSDEIGIYDMLPKRNQISHKGSNGFLGIFAGSAGMEGAALLAGQGALYSGGGKIAVVSVEQVAERLAGKIPELMISSLGTAPHFTEDMIEAAWEKAQAYDVLAIGPGLGRAKETGEFVKYLAEHWEKTLILDADALYAVAKEPIDLASCPGNLILTPHVGEFATLTGLSPKEIETHRIDVAMDFAQKHQVTLVLKGAPTVVALPFGKAVVNTTGNPGMASGGMGDTLTGIIAALAGQGLEAEEAATVGVYLHGLAADLLAQETPVGFTASDVARYVPKARAYLNKECVMRNA